MSGIKKTTKKILQNTNIINTGPGPAPPPTPEPGAPPAPVLPVPVAITTAPDLQPPVEGPTPLQLQQVRQRRLARAESSLAGRAATILSRRNRAANRSGLDGDGGGSGGGQTYANSVLGK